jgi:hypothetical protein
VADINELDLYPLKNSDTLGKSPYAGKILASIKEENPGILSLNNNGRNSTKTSEL